MSVNLMSLNVNGVRDKEKRLAIFDWLKEQNADVIFLQETHAESDEDILAWGKEWGGEFYSSHVSNFSKGVAILIKPKLKLDLKIIEKDTDGRFLIAELKADEKKLLLINIYTPNSGKQRATFYKQMKVRTDRIVLNDPNYEKVIGGDFNCAPNLKLDRRKEKAGIDVTPDKGVKELEEWIKTSNLEDIWRRRNPKLKRYTYFKPNSRIASRIDYWLISCTLDSYVTQTSAKNAPRTDHAAIQVTIKTIEIESGRGFWKMNNEVIKSILFKQIFKTFWEQWKGEIKKFKNKAKWWDITKVKIRELCIYVAKDIKSKHRKEEKDLEKMIFREQNKQNPDLNKIKVQKTLQNELVSLKLKGSIIRARALYFENYEKPTRYFYDLEKTRAKNKLWNSILDERGNLQTGLDKIMKEQVNFYSELLKSEGYDQNEASALINNIDCCLSKDDKEMCDQYITEIECTKVIRTLKKNKSPGEDGITSEFYQDFWCIIKDEFMQMLECTQKTEELTKSQYRGIITLLYKQGTREDIKNWRPITLLNIDYKIIAKIYGERLKLVLPKIIKSDQKAFLKSRQISENIRLTEDIITYTDQIKSEGAIIFLDQEKAFDRVEWEYLKMCLNKFGFGNRFTKWIMMLYKHGMSSINTNGFLSEYFTISRSMRQGCPVAAYLYILQAEPMAEAIRKSNNIDGIELPVKENGNTKTAKISLFDDDTQIFCKNESSITNVFKVLEQYAQASGAKINYKKTKGIYIGNWKGKEGIFKKIEWVQSVKALGVMIGYNINYEEIWLQKFAKFKETILKWKRRDLTIYGKKMLLNAFVYSVLGYMLEMYPDHIPKDFEGKMNSLCGEFIWGGKTWRIARKTLTLKKEHGGIQLPDFATLVNNLDPKNNKQKS